MKILHVVHNKITGSYILDPYSSDRNEYRSFECLKKELVEKYCSRKIKIITNIPDEELSQLSEKLKIVEVK